MSNFIFDYTSDYLIPINHLNITIVAMRQCTTLLISNNFSYAFLYANILTLDDNVLGYAHWINATGNTITPIGYYDMIKYTIDQLS